MQAGRWVLLSCHSKLLPAARVARYRTLCHPPLQFSNYLRTQREHHVNKTNKQRTFFASPSDLKTKNPYVSRYVYRPRIPPVRIVPKLVFEPDQKDDIEARRESTSDLGAGERQILNFREQVEVNDDALVDRTATDSPQLEDDSPRDGARQHSPTKFRSPFFSGSDTPNTNGRGKRRSTSPELRTSKTSRLPRSLASAEDLETELQWQAYNNPHPIPIRTLLTDLLGRLKIQPAQRHYEALILSNCSPAGSVKELRSILLEMERAGFAISPKCFAAALDVLAIHPCAEFAQEIFSSLDSRWIGPTPRMQHSMILSLIHRDQTELAYLLLHDLHASQRLLPLSEQSPMPKYLYVVLLRHFAEKQDYDAVMRLIYKLRDQMAVDMQLPALFWKWLLEKAALDGDGWVSGWIWQEWVEKMRIQPQRETCINVLKIAARDKVSWLAESVRDTVEHGGIDTTHRVGKSRATLDILAEEEENLVEMSYHPMGTSHSSSEVIMKDAGALSNDTQTGDDGLLGEVRKRSRRNIKPGNMWSLLKDESVSGNGRFDPWQALGKKSRR